MMERGEQKWRREEMEVGEREVGGHTGGRKGRWEDRGGRKGRWEDIEVGGKGGGRKGMC